MREVMIGVMCATAWGCSDPVKLDLGEECEISTQCSAPLVCRLSRCRDECRETRDCPLTTSCVLDDQGFGGCQLVDETECIMTSQCPTGLICSFGECVNQCETARDCPGGAACVNDPEMGTVCLGPAMVACDHTSACMMMMPGLVCAPDGFCRPQCLTDRDCRLGLACVDSMCMRSMGGDAGPATDAGVTDAGPSPDAGTEDAGTPAMDAGP